MLLTGPPLDPDADTATRLLEEELRRAEYNQPEPLIPRIVDWFARLINDLLQVVPGSTRLAQIILIIIAALGILALAYAIRGRFRSAQLRQKKSTGAVLEDLTLTAADYRARAQAAMRVGDWDGVLTDSYRAIAASADERVLLDDVPGRTAHEIAIALAPIFPGHAGPLAQAADGFDAVRYGDRHASQPQARAVLDLESTLRSTRPQHRDDEPMPGLAFGVPR